MTNTARTVVWDARYAPFGEEHAIAGAAYNDERFPGQLFDEETAFHYNYFRDYDPRTGRYLQSDPIGLSGGLNTYAYASGNPVTRIDRYGKQFEPEMPNMYCLFNPHSPACKPSPNACYPNGPLPYESDTSDSGGGSENDRCKKVLENCRTICVDFYVDAPSILPGSGNDMAGRIRRCIRECMEDYGCYDY
jgi:RHS repeat-associated protein